MWSRNYRPSSTRPLAAVTRQPPLRNDFSFVAKITISIKRDFDVNAWATPEFSEPR
jgi:hypothetical protein